MKLLLDTHIWIWSLIEPRKLSARVRREIQATKNELWLSSISIWEASMLLEAKRIRTKEGPRAWLSRVLSEAPLIEAPITHEVALESRVVAVPHQDPADRFIAATAKVHDLTLVTADENLLTGKGYRTLRN